MKAVDQRAQAALRRLEAASPVGAEVGVYRGVMSERLLRHPTLELWMIDNWKDETEQPDHYLATGDKHAFLSRQKQQSYYEEAKRHASLSGRGKVLRMDSVEAAQAFPDGFFDFVFIDGDHSFEGCIADIRAWAPKIKRGGWLCGHDYNLDGVRQAVEKKGRPELDDDNTWFIRV